MKTFLAILACSLLGAGCRPAGSEGDQAFYLQLVRGNDQEEPPTPGARPIGPRLSHQLHSVFRWRHYWELKRELVMIREGQTVRRKLAFDREVEVELLNPQSMAARVYVNGKLAWNRKQPAEGAFFVAGANKGPDQSWFIVVRRDQPVEP